MLTLLYKTCWVEKYTFKKYVDIIILQIEICNERQPCFVNAHLEKAITPLKHYTLDFKHVFFLQNLCYAMYVLIWIDILYILLWYFRI